MGITVENIASVSGEWSPLALSRTDRPNYSGACRTMRNFYPEIQGPASNRQGTLFVCKAKDSAKITRVHDFRFSVSQGYALIFGDQNIRFIMNGGLIVSAKTISGAADNGAGLIRITATSHGFQTGNTVTVAGVAGTLEANGTWIITVISANTYDLVGSAFANAYISGGTGTAIVEVSTPYVSADLALLKFEQSADTLYIRHPSYDRRKLTRSSHTAWTLSTIVAGSSMSAPGTITASAGSGTNYVVTSALADGTESVASPSVASASGNTLTWVPVTSPVPDLYKVYQVVNGLTQYIGQAVAYAAVTITGAANNGAGLIRITSAAHGLATGNKVLIAGVTGTTEANGSWTVTTITANTYDLQSSTFSNAYVSGGTGTQYSVFTITTAAPDVNTAAPVSLNPFNGAGNWPGCCAFFGQRLFEARTNNKPQSFNGSVVGDFENSNISTPVQDSDALAFTLNSSEVNEIKWMLSFNNLILGTAGAEWLIVPDTNGLISPKSTPQALRQSRWGCSDIAPLVLGHDVIFVEASRRKVRDLFYSIMVGGVNGGYDANDLSILAQHLFDHAGIADWAFQQHPTPIVWCVRDDGVLLGLTFVKEHQIYAWHRHDTQGTFESVCCVGNVDGTKDVYFVVNRTLNGTQGRYIEKLATRTFTDVEDAIFLDCATTYDGSVAATLTPGAGATVIGQTAVVFTAGSSVFVSGDVGKEIHYRYATYETAPATTDTAAIQDPEATPIWHTAIAVITGYTSGTVVTATIANAWPSTALIASSAWRKSVTTVSGLPLPDGTAVSVLADGSVIQNLVCTGGAITLPHAASKVQVGLAYTCDLEPVSFNFPSKSGAVQDKIRTIPRVTLRLVKTRSCWVGPDLQSLEELKFRTNESGNEPTNLFTGITDPVNIGPATDKRAGRIFIRVTDPLPITVAAIYPYIDEGQV